MGSFTRQVVTRLRLSQNIASRQWTLSSLQTKSTTWRSPSRARRELHTTLCLTIQCRATRRTTRTEARRLQTRLVCKRCQVRRRRSYRSELPVETLSNLPATAATGPVVVRDLPPSQPSASREVSPSKDTLKGTEHQSSNSVDLNWVGRWEVWVVRMVGNLT